MAATGRAIEELAFFAWTVANTLTIVFIAKGIEATRGRLDVERQTASLLIGALIWSYLGIVFEILTRDRRLGALGGNDRVHAHGAAAAGGAPGGHGCVRCPCTAWRARRRCSRSSRCSSG